MIVSVTLCSSPTLQEAESTKYGKLTDKEHSNTKLCIKLHIVLHNASVVDNFSQWLMINWVH